MAPSERTSEEHMAEQKPSYDFGDDLTDDYLLSFVTDSAGTNLTLHLDLQGAKYLIGQLEIIKQQLELGDLPHLHLLSSIGPPDGLTTTKIASQESEANIVHRLKIYGWN